MIKILKEQRREDGKVKIIESFTWPTKEAKKIPLTENTKLIEKDGKNYSCLAAYTFPISRPGEKNLNERVYGHKLWENVINNQKGIWEGAYGLCDHPEDEGSVKDTFCVWHNLRFNENRNLVLADCYLFGEWGKHAKEALDAGGKIGTSSVGWGDLDSDGMNVLEESYEIERPADWVLNPSYQIYGVKEDSIDKSGRVKDNIVKEEIIKENKVMDNDKKSLIEAKKKRLEEKSFRKQINTFFEDAKKIKDVDSKVAELEEIVSYFDSVDYANELKEEIEKELEWSKKELEETLEKGKKYDLMEMSNKDYFTKYQSLYKENESLENKLELAYKLLNTLKEKTNGLSKEKNMIEGIKNSMVDAKEYADLQKELKESENTVESLYVKLKETEEEIKNYKLELEKIKEERDFILEEIEKEKRESRRESFKINSKRREIVESRKRQEILNKLKEDREYKSSISGMLNLKERDSELTAYLEDLEYGDSEFMKKHRDSFKECKSLVEAQRKYLELQDADCEITADNFLSKQKSSFYESVDTEAEDDVFGFFK